MTAVHSLFQRNSVLLTFQQTDIHPTVPLPTKPPVNFKKARTPDRVTPSRITQQSANTQHYLSVPAKKRVPNSKTPCPVSTQHRNTKSPNRLTPTHLHVHQSSAPTYGQQLDRIKLPDLRTRPPKHSIPLQNGLRKQ